MSSNVFLLMLNRHQQGTDSCVSDILRRILPLALVGKAAQLHRLIGCELWGKFWGDLLPHDYQLRMGLELKLGMQTLEELLFENRGARL